MREDMKYPPRYIKIRSACGLALTAPCTQHTRPPTQALTPAFHDLPFLCMNSNNCASLCVCVCVCVCVSARACMSLCLLVYVCVCVHVCICACLHEYVQMAPPCAWTTVAEDTRKPLLARLREPKYLFWCVCPLVGGLCAHARMCACS